MSTSTTKNRSKRPLTPWELPKLLEPMHTHKPVKITNAKDRPHFPAILGFVYRNRLAVASQIQRRFASILKTDRTTRRHLAEMESLGFLGLVETRNTSPLWPKIYFVTKTGASRLRAELERQSKPGQLIRVDRSRSEGHSGEHVLHELLITEFGVAVWQTIQARDNLDLLQIERRSLPSNDGLICSVSGKATRLEPDAMFVHRVRDQGMICSFVELDMGNMSMRQIEAKFARYEAWATSSSGQEFLTDLYHRHGATNPRPGFRLLLVAGNRTNPSESDRVADLLATASGFVEVQKRAWFTTCAELCQHQFDAAPLSASIWRKVEDVRKGLMTSDSDNGHGLSRDTVRDSLSDIVMRPLFGAGEQQPVLPIAAALTPTPQPAEDKPTATAGEDSAIAIVTGTVSESKPASRWFFGR